MSELDEGDEFKVHGFIDVAGLENGNKCRVEEAVNRSGRRCYRVKNRETGELLLIKTSEIDLYLDNKSYIEVMQNLFTGFKGSKGRITRI